MICGVTAEIYVESYPPHSFSTALMSNKTFKTRIPRMAQIYGHCLILAVYLALLAWKVPFSHSTAQQEQKVNYVRCHFTEIRYEWQLPRKHCSINATSVFTESQKLSHEGSMLGAISSLWTVPHGKNPHWSSPWRSAGHTLEQLVQGSVGRAGESTLDGCQVHTKMLLSPIPQQDWGRK